MTTNFGRLAKHQINAMQQRIQQLTEEMSLTLEVKTMLAKELNERNNQLQRQTDMVEACAKLNGELREGLRHCYATNRELREELATEAYVKAKVDHFAVEIASLSTKLFCSEMQVARLERELEELRGGL